MKLTQKQIILNALENYGSLTAHQASRTFGIDRLAARIGELKNDGHDIEAKLIAVRGRNGKAWVCRYSLA